MTSTTVLSSAATADRRVATSGASDERAGWGIDDGAVDLESCSAGMDEVQLLMLFVGGIGVVVLPDESVAGEPRGVAVDPERGDPEVVADRLPVGVGM